MPSLPSMLRVLRRNARTMLRMAFIARAVSSEGATAFVLVTNVSNLAMRPSRVQVRDTYSGRRGRHLGRRAFQLRIVPCQHAALHVEHVLGGGVAAAVATIHVIHPHHLFTEPA